VKYLSSGLTTAVAAILIFGAIILFHELGHFTVAKWAGVSVHEFSIGMGPAIFKRTKNGTLYSLRILPVGGYVMMEGEDEPVDVPGSFSGKPLLHRIAILLAGSFNNLVMGYLILVVLTIMTGYVGTTRVALFNEGAVSSQQLQLGDKITKVNGHWVHTSNDITYEFLRDRDGLIEMTVQRNGQSMTLAPIQFKMEQLGEGMQAIDLDFKVAAVPAQSLEYVTYPFNWGLSIIKQVWGSLIDVVTGRYAVNQLSGPVGVVSAIGQASKMGFENLLLIAAFIAINIGIFNLVPFPILDGGKIMIAVLEAVIGRRINQRVLEWIMMISVGLLLTLMLYVTWNDIFRLFQ
jgi:regulator of sigma E protease